MKKFQGFSTGAVAGIIVGVAILALIIVSIVNNKPVNYNYIMEPSAENGFIGDHVKGSPDAPVIIYEYADFQCEYCAMLNPFVNGAIEVAEGNLAVVYRSYILPYHTNGQAAAAAAEAAGLQGYYLPFANHLFTTQDDWAYATTEKFNSFMESYFTDVTDGAGDLARFNTDRASENVLAKVKNDTHLGSLLHVGGTPAFFYDNQLIDFSLTYTSAGSSSIKVGDETISWDHSLSGTEVAQLFLDIVNYTLHPDASDSAKSIESTTK